MASDLSDTVVHSAARILHGRQMADAGWGLWSRLTRDDKQTFYDDVRAVARALEAVGAFDEDAA